MNSSGSSRIGASLARLGVLFERNDTTTEEGRSRERYRRASLTATSSLISRGLLAIISLASVPLTISYLGRERYGMWVAINVLLTWAVIADFGIGRGLLNQLSDAMGKEDRVAAQRAFSTALISLCLLGGVFLLALMPSAFLLPWDKLLNITDPALKQEAPAAVAAVFFVFVVGFPLGAVGHLYSALQRGYVANLFVMAGSCASLLALVVVIKLELGLPYLVLALGGTNVLARVANLAWALHKEPWLSPRWSLFDRAGVRSLTRLSTPLFIYQVGAVLITELQALAIAHAQGLDLVADYAVFQKVLTIPAFLVNIIEAPFGPALREAFARGDRRWLRSAFWRLQYVRLGLSLVALPFFMFFGNHVSTALSAGAVTFGLGVWLTAFVYSAVGSWNGGFNQLFAMLDRGWTLAWLVLLNGLVTAPLTYFLAARWGILGAMVGTCLFSVVVGAPLSPYLARSLLRAGK